MHAHEAQLARDHGRVAERAGRGAAHGRSVVVRRQVRHDGREGEDVAAGRDLSAQRRRVQRDRAAQRRRRQQLHLRAWRGIGAGLWWACLRGAQAQLRTDKAPSQASFWYGIPGHC